MITITDSHSEINVLFEAREFDQPFEYRTDHFDLFVSNSGDRQLLRVVSHTADPAADFCRAGCEIQKINYYPGNLSHSYEPTTPLVSCIILLTFNDLFVRNFLIPSIIANTNQPYEIIIVYNGVAADLALYEPFRVIISEPGWVARGYNAGVEAARGKYIAIFHDDCIVCDPGWDRAMIRSLSDGNYATSTEAVYNPTFHFTFLKGTPLMMLKEDYENAGGHDESFFAGIEDMEFSFRILSRGLRINQTVIPYRHFNGMSTVILLSGRPHDMRKGFGYGLIPVPVIEKWKIKCMNAHVKQEMIRAVHTENLRYFTNKIAAGTGQASRQAEAINSTEYPALNGIRDSYQQWLADVFKSNA